MGICGNDFITHLPMTKNCFDAITTWVDLFTGKVDFIPSNVKDNALDISNNSLITYFGYKVFKMILKSIEISSLLKGSGHICWIDVESIR